MAFTQDELEAFNSILEQKLTIQKRELERSFAQHINEVRHEFAQRISTIEQEIEQNLLLRIVEQQRDLKNTLDQQSEARQAHMAETVRSELQLLQQQQQEQFSDLLEKNSAAQLLAVEQLLARHLATPSSAYVSETRTGPNGVEIQTEVSWEELIGMVDRALNERMSTFTESLLAAFKNTERSLTAQLQDLRSSLMHSKPVTEPLSELEEVFHSLEQLERIIESIQLAMTANHALLSNRLSYHQRLPAERAHVGQYHRTISEPESGGGNNHFSHPAESSDETE
ncbi:MAG: hypothetical protein IMW89_07555 [Ktedonobacteraceae bacterium]|nr:hypothetical protein [Ktedonobacteraceae bacterium]